jgi:capsular exopolysaccharide synthesis family protein
MQAVGMNKSLDQDLVVIMESASKASPIDPQIPLQMTYGLLAGLLMGAGIIYLLHRFDDKINSPLELQDTIESPVLGQIPLVRPDKETKRVPLITEDDLRHEYLEQFRSIRSAVLFHTLEAQPPRSLMISSAAPGEGKSTLAANLASVFAHAGTRTLLIDADLRRGVQHQLFDQPLSPGLSDYLQGEVAWPDLVRPTSVANLDLITRGAVPRRPGDLFLNVLADQLLRESLAAYDIVLWDTAPLLAANDAANLCAKMEGILFVARIRHTPASALHTALGDLAQKHAKILGVILNAVEPSQPGCYGRYRYSEYYSKPVEA